MMIVRAKTWSRSRALGSLLSGCGARWRCVESWACTTADLVSAEIANSKVVRPNVDGEILQSPVGGTHARPTRNFVPSNAQAQLGTMVESSVMHRQGWMASGHRAEPRVDEVEHGQLAGFGEDRLRSGCAAYAVWWRSSSASRMCRATTRHPRLPLTRAQRLPARTVLSHVRESNGRGLAAF